MKKTILHCDMNNFYASVECKNNPSISHYPLAVSGNPLKRSGIILAKNYLAKAYGVKTGDVLWEAKQKCPTLICVAPKFELYEEYSHRANEIYSKYTDKIEKFGIDESWLDVTDSLSFFGGDAYNLAKMIQDDVYEQLGLTISIGVSFSKTLSKLGSDMKKPRGITVIDENNYSTIMRNISLGDIMMVGRKTLSHLNRMNIFTPYDLINYDIKLLKSQFGVCGVKLYNSLLGIDDDNVAEYDDKNAKSIGNGLTTPKDLTNFDEVEQLVYYLSDMVSGRMRKHEFLATTISLTIKFADFTYLGAQDTYSIPFCSCESISQYALKIFNSLTKGRFEPIRALRVKCNNFIYKNEPHQLNFFSKEYDSGQDTLGIAIDNLRKKFGKDSIAFVK